MLRFREYFFFIIILYFISCSDSINSSRNPFLEPPNFRLTINTNLPLYNDLNTPGSTIYISSGGIKGIFVTNTGSGYFAWEASCPNHLPSDCSKMTKRDEVIIGCSCDDYTYSLISGTPLKSIDKKIQYGLLAYPTSFSASTIITISN